MAKDKNAPRYDKQGARRVMRKRDYLADLGGQLALGLMANLVGQLNYFYTDKVGLAVGSVGIVLAISKVIDAFTDVIAGNFIDHSKGGDHKYFRWILPQIIPAALIMVLMFTVPIQAGQIPGVIYALITNLVLSAGLYTFIATPFAAVMTVRSRSLSERGSIGLFRAVANYGAGMLISILTIPVTNMLGGTQSAWIKYGVVLGVLVFVLFAICCHNGRKAKFACDYEEEETEGAAEEEEEPVPFKEAMTMLLKNKYWVIILLFNLTTSVTSGIAASGSIYYCKWIFGNDNLVALAGALGFFATLVGFVVSKPIIAKLGVRKTIDFGVLGAAFTALIRCIIPTNFKVYIAVSVIGSFVQIPLMCLYGVLLAMVIDYNEYTYYNKMVGVSSGAIGIGTKIGSGVGSVILTACLALGAYNPDLEVATTSMRYAIYAFSNYLPLIINLGLFVLFRFFDLEEKLPAIHEELARRRSQKSTEQ